jgi:hypothetical protein
MNIRIFLAPALLLGLGSSLVGAAQFRQGLVKPIWVTTLPAQEGRVYAMGLAAFAPTEAQAVTQASQNARVEVLTRLRASVQADTRITSSSTVTREAGGRVTGSSEQQVGQKTRIQAQATDLPGLVVEETWADAAGRTAYALAYLDIAIAEQELRSRFNALKADLFQEEENPGAPRERMRKLGRLKTAQVEIAKLDDMAALLAAGGGDAKLRGLIRSARLSVDRQAEQLRASLTLSLDLQSRKATEIAGILRNAALKVGLGWAEADGEFQLVVDYQGDRQGAKIDVQRQSWNGWWHGGWVSHTVTKDSGVIVARGVVTITLRDRAGTQYESVDIEGKGVGVTDFQSEQRLKTDFKEKLEKAFGKWLENLVK